MKTSHILIGVIALMFLLASCTQNIEVSEEDEEPAGPPTIVYKTKGDYSNLATVLLSEDKSSVAYLIMYGISLVDLILRVFNKS